MINHPDNGDGRLGLPPNVPPPEHVEQPQPIPVTVRLMIVEASPTALVRLELHHAGGVQVVFLPPDQAEQVGQGLLGAAKQASTGLVIARGTLPG